MECRVGQHEFGVLLDNPNLTEQSCIVERVAGIALGRQAATLVAQLTRLVEAVDRRWRGRFKFGCPPR